MSTKGSRIVAFVGAGLLAIGTFLPLVHVPKRGSFTLMQADWWWAGVAMLLLAGLAALLALIGRMRLVALPGGAALALLAYAYVHASTEIERARMRLGGGFGDDPLARLGDLAASNSRFEYGWAVLVFGALGLIAASVMGWRGRSD